MKNASAQLKTAMEKTTNFILSLEVKGSNRLPEWYEQIALSTANDKLNDKIYTSLLNKLIVNLKKEFGSTATKYILKK